MERSRIDRADEGITNEVIDRRRSSSRFVPIARPREKKLFFCQIETLDIVVCTPDLIACVDDSYGLDDLLNLLIETTGEDKEDKAAKVAVARTLWVAAVSNRGGVSRWDFIKITDSWGAQSSICNLVQDRAGKREDHT